MAKKYNRKYKSDEESEQKKEFVSNNKKTSKGKSRSKDKDIDKGSKSKEYDNDASWYIPDDTLRNQAAAYPMNEFIGIPDEFKTGEIVNTVQNIPTVMTARLNPSLGRTAIDLGGSVYEQQAAVNVIARIWYNEMSAITGRTANYTPDDIAIIIGAMSELVSAISFAFRCYGIAFNYSIRNRSLAKALLGGAGIDADALLNDMAGFRMRLNMLLVQANSLPIPADVKLFIKNWEVYSKVFVDETSVLAQYYQFAPFSTWTLDERTSSVGSKLITTYFDSTTGVAHATNYTFTPTGLLKTIETMILHLQMASTYNMVYADMLNFLEKKGGKLFSFGYLPELYTVTPEWSEEAITQFHNLTIMGKPNLTVPTGAPTYTTPDNDVEADIVTGIVHYNPTWVHGQEGYSYEPLIDFPFTDNPSVDDKINAMRYMCMRNIASVAGVAPANTGDNVILPDKYVVAIAILYDAEYSLSNSTRLDQPASSTFGRSFAHQWLAFRHYPTLYLINSSTGVSDGYIQELNYFTHLTFTYLKRVHDLSMYGLLSCPLI